MSKSENFLQIIVAKPKLSTSSAGRITTSGKADSLLDKSEKKVWETKMLGKPPLEQFIKVSVSVNSSRHFFSYEF